MFVEPIRDLTPRPVRDALLADSGGKGIAQSIFGSRYFVPDGTVGCKDGYYFYKQKASDEASGK